MIERLLDLPSLLKKKSFFLFGPRATGKSFLIHRQFPDNIPVLDLLRTDLSLHLMAHPYELEAVINRYPQHDLIVIDEIQKIPALLDEVHRLIALRNLRFLLTGSSARKLRQAHMNLLAGRAWEASLFPLTSAEIPDFNLSRYLQYGGLPPVYLSDEPQEELIAYVNTYLQQEIQAESWIRKIPAFSRFLETSALSSGCILNFRAIASDTAIPASTVREYYQILEDTFLGFIVPAWKKHKSRKALSTAKFYLFDLGVRNTLAGIKSIDLKSREFGILFEHFIALELRAYIDYRRKHVPLQYWRSTHGHEIDFIVGDEIAIEVKSTHKITDKQIKPMQNFSQETNFKQYIMISQDPISRKLNCIDCMYWKDFLKQLWNHEIIK